MFNTGFTAIVSSSKTFNKFLAISTAFLSSAELIILALS